MGKLKLALMDLNEAIEEEPRYIDALWQRHLIYIALNEIDKALIDLNAILKYQKTHAGAYLSRYVLATFTLLIHFTAFSSYYSRGDILSSRNDVALAIVNYSQSIKYDPNNYEAYYKRAKMYEKKGDIRMAMDDYLTTTKLNPKVVDAWFKHGMNYFQNR